MTLTQTDVDDAVALSRALLIKADEAVVILTHPAEFVLGLAQSSGNVGVTYDDDPGSPRSTAYDLGRGLGRAGTMGEEDDTIGVVLTRRHYGEGYRR